jgi:hypothetical protein
MRPVPRLCEDELESDTGPEPASGMLLSRRLAGRVPIGKASRTGAAILGATAKAERCSRGAESIIGAMLRVGAPTAPEATSPASSPCGLTRAPAGRSASALGRAGKRAAPTSRVR